ncbi:DMT family transporter [Sphingomonas bacterium]|uniref:DMT family transporter n=1 Tax=Sphingomonas bacterium TaxID=1895847 RepID=UPI001575F4F9|nr:DMT family transporter [Sphingomonas bacterium]
MPSRSLSVPFVAACLGIAIYSVMDTLMKRLSIDSGAYAAVLWRSVAGIGLMGGPFVVRRRWPSAAALRLHLARGLAAGVSVLLFFFGMARVPMAQAVAITFLAPLIAIFLAAATLGERVRRAAIGGSAIAAAGVLVIAAGEASAAVSADTVIGTVAIFVASILYAASLVLLRRQAQVADPLEVAFFASLVIGAAMLPAAPWLAGWPAPAQLPAIAGSAVLGTLSALLLAWAYARAEAQALVTVEYTAFVWAALFGWLAFGERVSGWTVAGAVLIMAGCAVAVRHRASAAPLTEAAA